MAISYTDVSEAYDRVVKERDQARAALADALGDTVRLDAELEAVRKSLATADASNVILSREITFANQTLALRDVEIARMRPVFELARRWRNRPLSVSRDWLLNDQEMFKRLHDAVDAAVAAASKECADGQ